MNRVCVDSKTAIYTFSNIHNLNQLFKVEISLKQSSKVKINHIFYDTARWSKETYKDWWEHFKRRYFPFINQFNGTFNQRNKMEKKKKREKHFSVFFNVKTILWYPSNTRLLIKHFSLFKAPFNVSKAPYQRGFKVKKPLWILSWQSSIHIKASDLLYAPSLWQNECKTKILTAALCILMTAGKKTSPYLACV